MTKQESINRHHQLLNLVFNRQIKKAIDLLKENQRLSGHYEFYDQIEELTETYKRLLHYTTGGFTDPQRDSILNHINISILNLGDDFLELFMESHNPLKYTAKQTVRHLFTTDPQTSIARIEEIFFHRELNKLLEQTDVGGEEGGNATLLTVTQADNIFKMLWLTRKFSDDHLHLIRRINVSEQIPWHEKCQIVSAITLGLLDYFDHRKFILLIEFITRHDDQVYQRALTGLILCLLRHDTRITFYPELLSKLKALRDDETLVPEAELIMMQLLQARETEKIIHEFETEVLPEMKKMMPRIEDKLQLNDQSDDEMLEGKNPGWKDMIGEVPGLFEKIEKFSKLQMEGGDVFMSTFSQLKRFDFFNTLSNWFVPFYADHPEIAIGATEKEDVHQRLLESLEKAFYICNSDKYSFAINFRVIPEQQRTMILTNFEAEFAQMKEMASEEQILDKSITSNAAFIQYIQDLYRFFKLYPFRVEFEDVFQLNMTFGNLHFYKEIFDRPAFVEKIAAFHFEKNNYDIAIESWQEVMSRNGPQSEYFEKIGYCHQKSGRLSAAVEFYKKAELFDADRQWILKKLGWCYLKLNDYQNALVYFEDAVKHQPEDLTIQLHIGQCYLQLKSYEKALHHYLQLRYFAPENLKVLRPTAWCHFVMGQPEQALEIYAQIFGLTGNPSVYDLMNAGHVHLCLGNRKEALSLYRQCLQQPTVNKKEMITAFSDDAPFLIQNGIPDFEVPLIRDYLMFLTEA